MPKAGARIPAALPVTASALKMLFPMIGHIASIVRLSFQATRRGAGRIVHGRTTLTWLGSWAALALLSASAAWGVQFRGPETDTDAVLVTLALIYSWLAVLLNPASRGRGNRAAQDALWAVVAAAGFLLLSLSPVSAEPGLRSLQVAGGVLTLVLLYSAVHGFIRLLAASPASSMALFTLLAAVFLAAPLYLGALAVAASERPAVANVIIAASPASYIAAIIDYDYLRSGWFYRHTPFGGLRFDYPGPGFMTACYLIITSMLAAAAIFRPKPEQRTLEQ